ncbi:transposase [Blautia sp. AM28-27]|nr:transposase [Blautia sp. AM28-36]RHS02235.1 transposase [Blautia sp. AF14-40]RHT61082.1 transposase [Blautia sp. AM28-27]RHT79529.1 transposase [Blautia sp. AM28-10]
MTAYSQGFHSIIKRIRRCPTMARSQRKYDHEYKVQAVKLAKEIGGAKAAKELGIPEGTIHTWLKAVRTGQLDIGEGAYTPESAMSLAEELTMLRKRVKDQDKEIRRLKEENEFLEEASAFFAASPVGSLQDRKNEIHCD